MKITIDDKNAVAMLAALAQETRLALFRLLIKKGPDGMMAGEIAQALGVPNSTLSYHLTTLEKAGLICATKQQRSIYYATNQPHISGFFAYLIEDCCQGAEDTCFTFMMKE